MNRQDHLARDEYEGRRWQKSQAQLAAAQASSLANAQHFLAILHQYRVQPYPVYHRPPSTPDASYQLIAEGGWMVDPPRPPHKAGILLTESGHFFWYFHFRTATRQDKGVKHDRFYAAEYNPGRPGLEVSPYVFSDINSFGIASGLAEVYLENMIALLDASN